MRGTLAVKSKSIIFYNKYPTMCKSISYGIEMEPHARRQFEELNGLAVRTCGLFIDREFPYLAASPGKTKNYLFIFIILFLTLNIILDCSRWVNR